MKVDKSKSKGNYEYKSETKILFSGHVLKYKKNNGNLLESVEVMLQQDEKTNLFDMIVRLPATKHIIFSGLVLKEKSEVRVINKKDENL